MNGPKRKNGPNKKEWAKKGIDGPRKKQMDLERNKWTRKDMNGSNRK